MKNNSPSHRRYRAKRSAEFFRKPSQIEIDFYKRRIGELCEQFPEVFNKRMPLPLALGTHRKLLELTSFNEKEIKVLLKVWTGRWEYSCMATSVGVRYDLEGKESGVITETQINGFIPRVIKTRKPRLKIFCKRFLKTVGRPALIAVPVSKRPDLGNLHDVADEPEGS